MTTCWFTQAFFTLTLIHAHSLSAVRSLPQIQIYGFNKELYHNMSEAQHKSQGIVALSLMVQIGDTPNPELRIITTTFNKVLYRGKCVEFVLHNHTVGALECVRISNVNDMHFKCDSKHSCVCAWRKNKLTRHGSYFRSTKCKSKFKYEYERVQAFALQRPQACLENSGRAWVCGGQRQI